MYNNPAPEEKTEAIEELQPRMVPQTPLSQPQGVYPVPQGVEIVPIPTLDEIESNDARREDALTIKFAIGKLNDYLRWFLMVLETILLIRFLLKLFGADPTNPFANFIFTLTGLLLVPFNGIVATPSLHRNQYFEFSTLIGMGVYFLIFYAFRWFLRILISNPEEPVE